MGIRPNAILQVLTVISKSFFTNAAFIPVYYSCLWRIFSASKPIFPLCFCISRESVVFQITSVFVQELRMHNEEKQSHSIAILKMYQNYKDAIQLPLAVTDSVIVTLFPVLEGNQT